MNHAGVYLITALCGNRYVGSSQDIGLRWARHTQNAKAHRHHSLHFQRCWNLHAGAGFKIEVLEVVVDSADLITREQHWLDVLKPELNIQKIAGSQLGYRHGEPAREKMRQVALARPFRARGPTSPRTREKISLANSGRKLPTRTAEHREAIARSMTGKRLSEETIRRISQAKLGSKLSQETISKRTASWRANREPQYA